jgi:hypothetical protein
VTKDIESSVSTDTSILLDNTDSLKSPRTPAKRTKSWSPNCSSTPGSHKRKTQLRIDVQKEKAMETKISSATKSNTKTKKQKVNSKRKKSNSDLMPIARLNASKSKVKNIIFGPSTLHASLRDCFFYTNYASSPKGNKLTSHGSSSIAILHARHGFPTSLQRTSRSSPSAVSNSATVIATRSSRRISLMEKSNTLNTNNWPVMHIVSSPPFLIHNSMLRRLLLEDILILNVGDRVVFAVSPEHLYFPSYKRVLNNMPTKHPFRRLRNEIFHQIPATVVKNSFRDSLVGSVTNKGLNTKHNPKATKSMSYQHFSNLLGGNGGGAICVQFDRTSHEIEVKWKEASTNSIVANTEPTGVNGEIIMEVGNKKIKVSKAKVHPLISKDLFMEGEKKVIKMNIPVVRYEKKCRIRREHVGLHDNFNTFMKSMGEDYDEVLTEIKKAIEQEKAFNLI